MLRHDPFPSNQVVLSPPGESVLMYLRSSTVSTSATDIEPMASPTFAVAPTSIKVETGAVFEAITLLFHTLT